MYQAAVFPLADWDLAAQQMLRGGAALINILDYFTRAHTCCNYALS